MTVRAFFSTFGWPIAATLVALTLALLQTLGLIDVSSWSLPASPEFDRFAADLPSIGLAFLFGAVGAFVRMSSSDAGTPTRMRRLVTGGAVGVIAFFVLKSEVILHILYEAPGGGAEVSYYGLALAAVTGGWFASDLAGAAARRR